MTPISASCPSCHTAFANLDPGLAGKLIKCPRCTAAFQLPNSASPSVQAAPGSAGGSAAPLSRRADGADLRDRNDSPRRRRKKSVKKKSNVALIAGLIGGGVALLVIIIVVIVLLATGGGGLGGRDPQFDQVKKGMSEDEVVKMLGATSWSYQPKGVGIWTYPRMTMEDIQKNPSRNREILDVIFVYFRDGKVDNIYRKTGAEFRQPPPR
jgi:predicted Zn finger-like uncharacterized protein